MVKTKKGKKEIVSSDEMDSDVNVLETVDDQETKEEIDSKTKKNKKKDKKKASGGKSKNVNSDDDDNDEGKKQPVEKVTKGVKKVSVGVSSSAGGKKQKAKKEKASSDEEEDTNESTTIKKTNKKSGFELLMAGGSDEDSDNNGDVERQVSSPASDDEDLKPTKNVKIGNDDDKGKAGKKGKKARRKKDEDEDDGDLDKVLAELEMEYSGAKKEDPVGVTPDNIVKEAGTKLTKQKITKMKSVDDTEGIDDNQQEDGEGGTVKTAAQKKKEKKERQRREAALVKQKAAEKKPERKTSESKENLPSTSKNDLQKESSATCITEASGDIDEVGEVGENGESSKKDEKKKKKKGKKDKEDKDEDKKDDKKKGVSKLLVAAMQERLKKIKEEEERLQRVEEEKNRLAEEREEQRLEAIRLEHERKEKKKQKEAERKARLKAEGKLLTKKQKEDRARAQAMLESLRAQGLEMPDPAEKRPRPGTRIRPNKKKSQKQDDGNENENENDNDNDNDNEVPEDDKSESSKEQTPRPPEIEIKPESVKEAWDASSSEDEEVSQNNSEEKLAKQQPPTQSVSSNKETTESDDESSEDESSSEEESESEDKRNDAEARRERAIIRVRKRREEADKKRTTDDLRAAVVCVLGHVDTGKTKILDKLRRTHVQDSEAGGITQQIGATNVPIDAIKEQVRIVKNSTDFAHRLPGLLIIDTPGHESFSNLRNRGSSLCDIAILVVDIMHGIEPQTLESINLLKAKKCPFIVALNKIDRLYDWNTMARKDIHDIIKAQQPNTQLEFQQRTKEVILQFAEQGLNASLFYENPDPRTYVSLVPTSAITGEGMGNLLFLITEFCQNMLAKKLMYSEELQATVLEVKAIPGLGTTIDAILINGKLREGETMIIAGTDGPIVTQIRSLLMPQPMKELRVKNAYIEYKEIKAAQGVKIAAKDLEKAIAGINLLIANKPDEVEICRDEVARELKHALSHIKLKDRGVYVQASTLGSLEALLEFLRTSKIPYCSIRIGPVVKRDVMKASTMLEHEPQYATILAFDVKIERDAQDMADSLGVKIFQADIIYHLFDKFMAYREELRQKKRDEFKSIAVFPCKLKILPQFIFNSRDPIVMGVMVENGIVKEGTPICVPSKDFVDIGIVTSIELNHKQIESARKGQEICIKIDPIPGESPKMFGRHFEATDMLVSKITRQSIDACKDYFRDDLIKADWALMVELKKLFEIL